ncbi:hypothetical protein TNCV_1744441 [Trichonephila clavipes]|nr:hypothetical protein TNCV_1744441 [Trichonephila clavipes]
MNWQSDNGYRPNRSKSSVWKVGIEYETNSLRLERFRGATRLLETAFAILNHGQGTKTTSKLSHHANEETLNLDKFYVHQFPTQRPVNWPPRSCDLTPLDYFLWGYVKSLVYADKPQTLDHLEDNIRRVIADIRPQMLEKVIENWTSKSEPAVAVICQKSYLKCNASRLSFE